MGSSVSTATWLLRTLSRRSLQTRGTGESAQWLPWDVGNVLAILWEAEFPHIRRAVPPLLARAAPREQHSKTAQQLHSMAPNRNSKVKSPGPKRDTKTGKNGKKEGLSGSSFFTWFMVIALLGVWTSVAVVWFDLVDYEEVLAKAKDFRYNLSEVLQGKLGIYDADGDGDFDVDDAKVLLGLKERPVRAQATPEDESEEPIHPDVQSTFKLEDLEELEEIIKSSYVQDDVPSQPDENEEDEVDDDSIKLAEEYLFGDLDDGNEELTLEGQPEEDDQQAEDEEIQMQTLTSNLQGAREEEEPEAAEEAEQIDEDTTDEPDTYDHEDEVDENRDNDAQGESESEQQLEPEPESLPETKPEPELELEPEQELEPEAELETEPDPEPEYEQEDEPESEPEPEEKLETHPEHEPEPELDTREPEEQEDDATSDALESTVVDIIDDEAAVPLPEPVSDDEDLGNTEQENEYISDKHPDETVTIELENTETYIYEPQKTDEKASKTEAHQEQPSGKTNETAKDKQGKDKKKKPKLLNKFDKSIKTELDAAEKLRKKGKIDEAVKAYEELVKRYPQSPRARYGKAQCEDDLAEKIRSNEVLQKAVSTYEEVANLPSAPSDLVQLALKRQANRQQFLGRTRGSLVTLQKLVQLFPDDVSLRNDLGVGYLLVGDNSNAKKVYEEVLSLAPNDGFAKVHYGFILKALNQIAESIPYLKEGLESGDPGTDDGRFYFHLGDAMQRVGNSEAYKWYEIGHKRGHFASVWQRSLYNVNGLKAQPWWTTRETGYTELVKSLERNWKSIRDEGLAVMDKGKGLFIPEEENLREKGDWSQYTLWQQGRKNENSCKSAPKTCALLERFPESIGCRRGQIKYSVMHPGTHVWPHTGPTNCRLRMHLGLVIPKEGCKIRCANDTRSWEEGKVLIFDDSFEHEVWQNADAYRLIFIVDVWHPELTAHQRRTLPAI